MMDITRMLPHNFEAEQSVLGSMLLGDDYAREGVSLLIAEDFYRQAHQMIFTAIVSVLRKNGGVDLISVSTELREQGVAEETGGAYYLSECTDAVPTAVNLDYHARKVRSCAVDRKMRELAYRAFATDEETPPEVRLDTLISQLRSLLPTAGGGPMNLPDAVGQFMELYDHEAELKRQGQEVFGAYTGLESLDKVFRGWRPGTLNILSAQSGAGKTAIAVQIAIANAKKGKRVAFYSLEMSRMQLVERILANNGGIDLWNITNRSMSEDQYARAVDVPERCRQIVIDDTCGLTVQQIHARTERLMTEGRFGIVIVDYLQIIRGARIPGQNRETQVHGIATDLKNLAKNLDVPVVVLCQLNREGKLRESDGIFHDADSETLYIRNTECFDEQQEVQFVIRKHRQGPGRKVYATWYASQVRIVDKGERTDE